MFSMSSSSILSEPTDGTVLDGSIQFDDPCIIAIARIKNAKPASDYTYRSIPFEYRKEIDPSKLVTGKYYTAIVFSSSLEGAYFRGAIGSTLIIDEATIELEKKRHSNSWKLPSDYTALDAVYKVAKEQNADGIINLKITMPEVNNADIIELSGMLIKRK